MPSRACVAAGAACSRDASRCRGRCPCAGIASRSSRSPSRWRTTSMRSAASPRSSTLKAGSRPSRGAYSRISRLPIEWKVPDQGSRRLAGTCVAEPAWRSQRLGHDALRAARHLERGAPREREQQHPLGRHAGEQQMGDAVRQRAGLAGAGAGDDQQRCCQQAATRTRFTVRDGVPLRGIQLGESGAGEGHGWLHYRQRLYGYPVEGVRAERG